MTLTPISSLESARKKLFMNSRYIVSRSGNQTFLRSRGRNDSYTHQFARIRREKKILWTRRTSCVESLNQMFLDSGSRNDSNTHQFALIGLKNFFIKSTYIMSRKWESNVFWVSRRNDSNTNQFARIGEKNFSWTRRTSCLEYGNQTFLGSGGRNGSNTNQFARIGEKKVFMNSRYIASRKWESNVFALRRPKWLLHPSVRANQREKNFLSTQCTSCLESGNQTFLGSGGRNDSNTDQFARIGEKSFHELDLHRVKKVGINRFLAQ